MQEHPEEIFCKHGVRLRMNEVIEDICLAEERYEDIRAGKSNPLPLEKVMKHYGMED